MKTRSILLAVGVAALAAPYAVAWDYEGHRLVNQVALAALPPEFPDFVRIPENAERIAFLAGEPDRWRNSPDYPLKQLNELDHYLDIEDLPDAGLDLTQVPPLRLNFAVQYAAARQANLAKFPPVDPAKNLAGTAEWPGFAPWAIAENFGKLRSAFSYLRAYQERGRPEEVANAQANILYIMGVMGHYVGDCAQPLHTTKHHHGWVGENPGGYTTWKGIHSWVDGGFIGVAKVSLETLRPRIGPAGAISLAPRADGRDPLFATVIAYLIEQNRKVEPLYALEKAGLLGNDNRPIRQEGRDFIEGQLVTGGQMLASIWLTAWRTSFPDTFLLNHLANRAAREKGLIGPPPQMPANK